MLPVCLQRGCLVLLLCGVAWAQAAGRGAPTNTGHQLQGGGGEPTTPPTPPDRECSSYTISIGIYTKSFYTCCGQMEAATPPLVDEEPVQNWDCNPRAISYADVNVTQTFNCNGDTGAYAIRGLCNARWGWLAADDCWKWPACFEGACQQEALQPGSVSLIDGFCGDGRCDAGSEDTASCPADCCPLANPDKCLVLNNTCTDSCCAQPACCARDPSLANYFWLVVFSVLGGICLLVVLCCCCCCCCIFRHCRSSDKCEKACNHPAAVDRQDTTMTVLSMK